MAPSTMKQWAVTATDKGFDGLKFEDAPVPKVGDSDVLIKLHAASLNYRDLLIPQVRRQLLTAGFRARRTGYQERC